MHHFSRSLATLTGLAICASAASAQVGPRLSVGPGLVATVASGTNNTLAGNPDAGGAGLAPSFNGVAYWNDPTNGPTLYLSDAAKHRVFQLVLANGQVTPFAGNGAAGITGDGGAALSAQLNEPSGIAVDSSGNVMIADTTANVVRRVDYASRTISRYVGDGTAGTPSYSGEGGPALALKLSKPVGIAFDSSNNLFIAASTQGRVLEVAAGSTVVTTVAGNGGGNFGDGVATAVALQLPVGVAISGGNVYISESIAHVVRQVAGGNITTVAGQRAALGGYSGDGGPAAAAALNTPYGLAVDAGGALYIADDQNHVIRKVQTDAARTITTIAGTNVAGYMGDGGSALSASLNGPSFMSINPATGGLYFVDSGNRAIRSLSATANPVTFPLTAVGANASSTITLSNVGDAPLSVSAANLPTNFVATGGSCGTATPNLAPGQSCNLDLQFQPTSGGSTAGNLNFTTSTAGVSADVYLTMSNGLRFVPVTPCRVVDTRLTGSQYGQFGGGALTATSSRDWDIRNSNTVGCASAPVPASANVLAYSLNVTVVPRGVPLQFLTLYPTGASSRPLVSTLNSVDGRVKANAAIVPVLGGNSSVSAYVTDATDVIMDINGYFVPEASSAAAQAYYPVPPCRVSDTRFANSTTPALGSPLLTGGGSLAPGQAPATGTARTIPVRSSSCGIPASASAYSLNITAVPRRGALTYLSIWPSDQTIPFVSTLNSPTGTVTANAAIVPASAADGSITAYATDDADLIVDISGYYAPPGAGGLALYNVTPCRAYDSRGTVSVSGVLPTGVSQQGIVSSGCSIPPAAQSYILNTTVVPTQPLIYITNWAHGTAQPLQSTLNAYDATVTSNLAIVPTIDGSISTYIAAPSALVVDAFAYFAP